MRASGTKGCLRGGRKKPIKSRKNTVKTPGKVSAGLRWEGRPVDAFPGVVPVRRGFLRKGFWPIVGISFGVIQERLEVFRTVTNARISWQIAEGGSAALTSPRVHHVFLTSISNAKARGFKDLRRRLASKARRLKNQAARCTAQALHASRTGQRRQVLLPGRASNSRRAILLNTESSSSRTGPGGRRGIVSSRASFG